MKITELVSITELARLLNKSRPTVYKYISDFEEGRTETLPESIRNLFVDVTENNVSKGTLYEYCKTRYSTERSIDPRLEEIVNLLKNNIDSLNLDSVKQFIEKELSK